MQATKHNHRSHLYDPTMPDASNVMAALLCVTTTYIRRPSYALARQALKLAETLTAPEYAESEQICQVSKQIYRQWQSVTKEHEGRQTQATQPHANAIKGV